jgi:hypothetical protein
METPIKAVGLERLSALGAPKKERRVRIMKTVDDEPSCKRRLLFVSNDESNLTLGKECDATRNMIHVLGNISEISH